MPDTTIDSILESIRNPENTEVEKRASDENVSFSENEIESMANLLKEAEQVQDEAFSQEKIAEMALVYSAAFDTLAEADKFEAFRKEASAKGYEEKDIDALIEKKASEKIAKNLKAKKQLLKKILPAALGGTALASGTGGYVAGKKTERKKTKDVARGAFRAGRLFQHGRHNQRMASLRQQRLEHLRRIAQERMAQSQRG